MSSCFPASSGDNDSRHDTSVFVGLLFVVVVRGLSK